MGCSLQRRSARPCAALATNPDGRAGAVGLDHLTLTAASLKELGAEGLFPPISLSCRDHEGGGSVKFQQWDGTQWTVLTDWIHRTRTWYGP